ETRKFRLDGSVGCAAHGAVARAGDSADGDQLHAHHHRAFAAATSAGSATIAAKPGPRRAVALYDVFVHDANLAAREQRSGPAVHERAARCEERAQERNRPGPGIHGEAD